jgi:hypothetical protein
VAGCATYPTATWISHHCACTSLHNITRILKPIADTLRSEALCEQSVSSHRFGCYLGLATTSSGLARKRNLVCYIQCHHDISHDSPGNGSIVEITIVFQVIFHLVLRCSHNGPQYMILFQFHQLLFLPANWYQQRAV